MKYRFLFSFEINLTVNRNPFFCRENEDTFGHFVYSIVKIYHDANYITSLLFFSLYHIEEDKDANFYVFHMIRLFFQGSWTVKTYDN